MGSDGGWGKSSDQENQRVKRKITVLIAILGMLATSGLAQAATEEDAEDTTFSFGYDEIYRVLVWGTADADGLYDCALEGEFDVTYGAEDDGIIEIPLLADDGAAVSFPPRMQDDLAEGLEEVEDDFVYNGSGAECGVVGTSVEGPNDQVNHGMFMKAFNQVYQGPGRGCIVRFLAQSDLGKGDQQITVPDVDPDAEQVAEEDVGTVDFTSVLADCDRGNRPDAESEELDAAGNGNRPDNPGAQGKAKAAEKKAEKAAGNGPGKSGDAPGRNK